MKFSTREDIEAPIDIVWAAVTDSRGDTTTAVTPTTVAPGSDAPAEPRPTDDAALGPESFAALGTCIMIPEMAAGPFPNRTELDRRDITEGSPGRPLRLGLRVVDATCAPVPDVVVELWHADATGDYSGYVDNGTGKDEGEGSTFLRGQQRTNGDGIVEFRTVYPGWYPGRAVHLHVRARTDDETLRTSQLFFPDDLTAEVMATGVYAEFGRPDTTNETDGLGGDISDNGSLLHVTPQTADAEPELLALLNLGLDTATG